MESQPIFPMSSFNQAMLPFLKLVQRGELDLDFITGLMETEILKHVALYAQQANQYLIQENQALHKIADGYESALQAIQADDEFKEASYMDKYAGLKEIAVQALQKQRTNSAEIPLYEKR